MIFKILIVEDEILIADTIKRYLQKKGYTVVGIAINYDEAIELIEQTAPDLVLLDIRLSDEKSGIDIARYIREYKKSLPFIFLTSQVDSKTLEAAKDVFPAGYLSKPIQKESLYTTIEITLHSRKQEQSITLNSNNERFIVRIQDILYLEADHIYVNVFISNQVHPLLVRRSLKELFEQLPPSQFILTHRSFVVNIKQVTSWDKKQIYVGRKAIPISRSNKLLVQEALDSLDSSSGLLIQ